MDTPKSFADARKYAAANKWVVALLAAILFFVMANPFLFQQTDKLARMISPRLGLASISGLPNNYGLALHAILFALIVRLLMF